MGLFKNLFGREDQVSEKEKKVVPWIALIAEEQLETIEINSAGKPQVIFKHSTTCGISRMVLNMFNQSYSLTENQMDLYYLDLHSYRAVSNAVAQKFNVQHQSPQLLIIKNGVLVRHASHGGITDITLEDFL